MGDISPFMECDVNRGDISSHIRKINTSKILCSRINQLVLIFMLEYYVWREMEYDLE